MAYALKPHRSVAHEVRRIADKQLAIALDQLHAAGTIRGDWHVHEARRHIKRVRALMRLVKPVLTDGYAGANRRLKTASRLLAPIADGRAVVDTLGRLAGRGDPVTGPPTLAAIRTALVRRAARLHRRAEFERTVFKAGRILSLERTRVAGWSMGADSLRAIAPGLSQSVRRSRKAMARALVHPTAENYHAWRRRVKDLWLQIRLVDRRCGNAFALERRRLAALDDCLGEYHNVVVLEAILVEEALVLRGDTIRGLRILREYQLDLRRRAARLGSRALAETPAQFMSRVRHRWHHQTARRSRTRPMPGRRAA